MTALDMVPPPARDAVVRAGIEAILVRLDVDLCGLWADLQRWQAGSHSG